MHQSRIHKRDEWTWLDPRSESLGPDTKIHSWDLYIMHTVNVCVARFNSHLYNTLLTMLRRAIDSTNNHSSSEFIVHGFSCYLWRGEYERTHRHVTLNLKCFFLCTAIWLPFTSVSTGAASIASALTLIRFRSQCTARQCETMNK